MAKASEPVHSELMVKERIEGMRAIAAMRPTVSALKIETKEDYLEADALLVQVRTRRGNWKQRMAKILDPLSNTVKEAKKALASATSLFDEVDEPWEQFETSIKTAMKDFKTEERRLIAEADAARNAELERLKNELAAKTAAEAKVKTSAMAGKLLEAKARLQQALADKKAETIAEPVKAAGSTPRVLRKYRILDFNVLVAYIVNGDSKHDDPADCPNWFDWCRCGLAFPDLACLLQIDKGQLDAKFKLDDPKLGTEWLPGVEVYEDINIAGRRQ